MKVVRLWQRRLAALWRQRDIGYTACNRCWRGFRFVKMHTTPFHACTEAGQRAANIQYGRPEDFEGDECAGVDVLCEECWQELTPDERRPFYVQQMDIWRECGETDERKIAKVMRAMERGL